MRSQVFVQTSNVQVCAGAIAPITRSCVSSSTIRPARRSKAIARSVLVAVWAGGRSWTAGPGAFGSLPIGHEAWDGRGLAFVVARMSLSAAITVGDGIGDGTITSAGSGRRAPTSMLPTSSPVSRAAAMSTQARREMAGVGRGPSHTPAGQPGPP